MWRRRHSTEILQDAFERWRVAEGKKVDTKLSRTLQFYKVGFGFDECPKCHTRDKYLENYPKPKLVTCLKCGLTIGIADWNAFHITQEDIETLRKASKEHSASLAEEQELREYDKEANRESVRKHRTKRRKNTASP